MSKKSKLSFNDVKVTVEDIGRNRMKVTFKLDREQSEAFKNFMTVKPENITDEDFYRHIFFVGIKSISDGIKNLWEENKNKLQEQAKESLEKQEEDAN